MKINASQEWNYISLEVVIETRRQKRKERINMRTILLLLFIISTVKGRYIGETGCRVSIDYRKGDLKEPQPLVLTDTKVPKFLSPNAAKQLVIPRNTSILLACPGKNNFFEKFGKAKAIKAVCSKGKQFFVESKIYEFMNFTCKVSPKENIKKANTTCLGNHELYDIGFTVGKHFLPLIEICRDGKTFRTYYSKAIISKDILGFQSQYPRPYWKYGSYYPNYSLYKIYKMKSQLISLETLLGSEELASKYIRPESYLNRGHLAAKADFIYGSQQTATFWLLNTAPQWSTFNAGNWLIVESTARNLAIKRGRDLIIYTGVHGITSLPDINGTQQPLHLHVNETDQAFPVPRFFWKVILEPISNRAIAFIGLNEPYATNITKDMYLCPDISKNSEFDWIRWEPENIVLGVSYICEVKELRKAIPTIPLTDELGLLL